MGFLAAHPQFAFWDDAHEAKPRLTPRAKTKIIRILLLIIVNQNYVIIFTNSFWTKIIHINRYWSPLLIGDLVTQRVVSRSSNIFWTKTGK